MRTSDNETKKLSRALIAGEQASLALYERLLPVVGVDAKNILVSLVEIEKRHLRFWEDFFHEPAPPLGIFTKFRISLAVAVARIFGDRAILLILESTEIHAIREYFAVWDRYRDSEMGSSIKKILIEELHDEEIVITGTASRGLRGGNIRNLFLGLNDGLVEILGVVSGLFAAFDHTSSVVIAALTVAIAGSFSMAAGVFAAESSENEIKEVHDRKRAFLDDRTRTGKDEPEGTRPVASSLIVGISYFFGAMVPILPIFFGARGILISFLASGLIAIVIATAISFVTGMNIRKRILVNTVILTLAVSITYTMGIVAKNILGVSI